jgi:polar amino acid transport system substrate-binding protein
MKAIRRAMKVAWDGIIPALAANQIDVIWASMLITAKRKETIDFTNMHYDALPSLIGPKDGDMDVTPDHLAGKSIGAQVSTAHQRYAAKYFASSVWSASVSHRGYDA